MRAVGAARRLGPGAWEVASSRPGEPPYQVHRTGPAAQCTCPGFQRWQTCKHVDLVLRQPEPQEESMQSPPPQRALTRVPVQPPAPLAVEEPSRALANLSVQDVAQLADKLARAQGFLPKGITEPAQVFAIVLTGQEVGIGPMAALRHIPMVEGKPDPSAELLLALIRHRYGPQTIRVAESTADHCTIEWRQPGWDGVQAFTWTTKDSERAGLHKKFNHQAYPAAMNRARAIKFVARSHFPEVALGLDLGGDEERGAVIPSRTRAQSTTDGLLTADELAPGGVHRGERGGILEDAAPARGEVVGLTACASCGTVAECIYDGKAYICRDRAACGTRVLQQAPEPSPPPEPPATDPTLVTAKQLDSIQAHLERTGTRLAPDLGPLEQLSRTEASTLLRDLGRLPNAVAAAGDEGEAF